MIEFRCSQCGATLRVPAGTEGKQAKCPQCSALMTIPTPTARPADPWSAATPPQPAPSGPADFSAPPPREGAFHQTSAAAGSTAEGHNPFQSPQYAGLPNQNYGASARGFQPTQIEFGRTFDLAWRVFKANLGLLVVASLVVLGISFVFGFGIGIIDVVIAGVDQQARANNPVSALINGIGNLIGSILQTFLNLGLIRLSLNLIRGEPASISDLFGEANKLVTAIFANILFFIAFAIGFVLLILPGIWVALTFGLFYFMIVDQGAGVIDSLKMSMAAMRGNKLTLLGLGLALLGLAILVVVPTCGLGMLLITPFAAVLLSVVYLGATGQLGNPYEQTVPYTTP